MMKARKAAAVILLATGLLVILGGYVLTTLWLPAYYMSPSLSYIHGAWRVVPAGGSEGAGQDPLYQVNPVAVSAKATFVSAANGSLWLEIVGYPEQNDLLMLDAPVYISSLDGSGGPGISFEGGNTTVYSNFTVPAGTVYFSQAIVNNGTMPVNSTYASWSITYPVLSHGYGGYGWAAISLGVVVAVAGVAILSIRGNVGSKPSESI
jgi:hypothetical protein